MILLLCESEGSPDFTAMQSARSAEQRACFSQLHKIAHSFWALLVWHCMQSLFRQSAADCHACRGKCLLQQQQMLLPGCMS